MHLRPVSVVLAVASLLLTSGCGLGTKAAATPPPASKVASKAPGTVSAGSSGTSDPAPPTLSPSPPILPGHRIVAYYGNPLSAAMGILGEKPQSTMIAQLNAQAEAYAKADPSTPVIKALDMVSVTAMGSPQPDHTYRLRMSYKLIQQELTLARSDHALLILDVQVGRSTVQSEVKYLAPFLAKPDVELALDPEFDMKPGDVPGKEIGTMKASAINWALDYLNSLVVKDHLPQKILIVHQFRQSMVPDWSAIRPVAHVAFVRDQDGFGYKGDKVSNYELFVKQEAVPCTSSPVLQNAVPIMSPRKWVTVQAELHAVCGGFKLFYKTDKPHPMTPQQVLSLSPPPLVVIYQ